MIKVLRTLMGGFLMGTADLIPGVSGGTIALVLGIYERLVTSVKEGSLALASLVRADFARMRRHLSEVELSFLVPLLTGILSAVFLLSGVLETQLDERPELLAGLFLGLVLGSVVIAWRLLRRPSVLHAVVAAVVTLGLFVVLGVGEGAIPEDPSALVFFGAGALAICAMILPGISGSLILVLVGMYAPVLGEIGRASCRERV